MKDSDVKLKEKSGLLCAEIAGSKKELQAVYNELYPVGKEVNVQTENGRLIGKIHTVPVVATMMAEIIDDLKSIDQVSVYTINPV